MLRTLTLTLLSLTLGALQTQQPGRSPMSAPGRITLPPEGVTARLIPDMRLPMVEVHIGEAGPYRFVVEWAGNVFAVSERVRDEVGLEVIARSARGSDVVAVPRLSLGEALFEDLVADVPQFFSRTNHDGALGLNLFRELIGTLDFPGGELRLSSEPLPQPEEDPTVVAYSPGPGGSPRIPIEIAGKAFEAVLDTAAERTLIVDEHYLDEMETAGELRPGPMIMTPGMGRLETREGRLAGELVIGSLRVSEPEALFHRMREPEILLGGGFLRDYALTLDQARRRLRLVKATEPEGSSAEGEGGGGR